MSVSFIAASSGVSSSTGPIGVSYPVSLVAGDILLIHIATRNNGLTINTPSGWTELFNTISVNPSHKVVYKVSNGTESGTETVSLGAGSPNVMVARMYQLRGAVPLFEGSSNLSVVGSTFGPASSLTNTLPGALALFFTMTTSASAIGTFTGETGGDWIEAVSEYSSLDGNDASLQFQIATMSTITTLSGGSASFSASGLLGYGTIIKPKIGGFQIIN